MASMTFQVNGMKCGGCVDAVTRAISGVAGVTEARVDLASGIANSLGKIATMGLAPAVFGPLMNITGSVLASYWHKKPPAGKQSEQEE